MRIAVIGAGAAGLSAATRLVQTGHDVVVVDKGRGVGGRMATRRFDGSTADHGAQFFTARSDEFGAEVERWIGAGVATEWHRRLLVGDGSSRPDGHVRYRGKPSMTAPAKWLAGRLPDVRTSWPVSAARPVGERWVVDSDAGEALDVEAVVLTPPIPQTLDLLAAGQVEIESSTAQQLRSIRYARCIALFVDAPHAALPEPGARRLERGPVEWIADNRRKGVSAGAVLTVHLDQHVSEEWWDLDAEAIHGLVAARLAELVGHEGRAIGVQKWRYARPLRTLPVASLRLRGLPPVVLAGDAFDGPLVEGAVRSGWDAARTLLEPVG